MNPYDLAGLGDDIEDQLLYEEFGKLAEAEQEAIIDREFEKYAAWWHSLSPQEKYRTTRRSALRSLAYWRAYLKIEFIRECPVVVEQIKKAQLLVRMRLVKARAFRATGVWPGQG